MKKLTFALMAFLVFSFSLRAQQYVSTQPSNRNVILEEFTGRNCQYCPDGHKIANEIAAANPGRFWAINVHAGGYAATSYPNFNTQDGTTIHNGFSISGYPCGVVNRSTSAAQGRGAWAGIASQQMNQPSECNVAGMAIVNPDTRVATITVEVYYTGNSAYDENYLTVAMLQDSILGSQVGMSYNPEQVVGNTYCHMHILRDVINESAWGDAISPTTAGTLITRTYEYQIPEIIGSPNGVEVDINNIFFLAWVSERYQGTPTRPILTGCELNMVQGSNDPIYPSIVSIEQIGTTCTQTKDIEVNIQNIGMETLTSMTVVGELGGQTCTVNWEGNLPRFNSEKVTMTMDVPFGTYPINVAITEVNGTPQNFTSTGSVTCLEWNDLAIEGEEEELRLELMQDKFGNQITWEFRASDGTILGSGGPYTMLAAGSGTQMHIEYVTVPAGECVKFTIKDSMGNGICCTNGQGYYIVKDSQGNVIFGDTDDGQFGESATHLISVRGASSQVSVGETEVFNINYTDADFVAVLNYEGYPEEVGFVYWKVTSSTQTTVVGHLNEFSKIMASVSDLEQSSVYMVKAYAIVNGEAYYGPEATFQTWMEGVDELERNLRLYPNPTSDVLNIEGAEMTSVEVYNAVGQCVMMLEVDGNSTQVNTEALNNGVYFVRVLLGNGDVIAKKIAILK